MQNKTAILSNPVTKIVIFCLVGIILFSAGIGIGLALQPKAGDVQPEQQEQQQQQQQQQQQPNGYAANPSHEYLAGAAAWQMSAEAHALMMQGFNLAERNIDEIVAYADNGINGYRWVESDGEKKLYLNDKRVCVVCDIDDTLVDGVHYTANILGKDGEWTNKAFTDFVQSNGCTALPGAVAFANYCKQNGIAIFYVTNRYDQGYKLSESGYAGQQGYLKADGTVIGSSTFDLFGKTMYDITMKSMDLLGFPTNAPDASNYCSDAYLIVNDTKLNGSSKEWIRQSIANGGVMNTGERVHESNAYPGTVDLAAHHIAMLLGDDLNDISQIFSDSSSAVDRVALSIEHMEKWGTEWIVFPNAVYGSSMNYAVQYGIPELFDYFDYTKQNNPAWELYQGKQ